MAKFVELNIPVYIPFGDNEKADLIAEFNGKLNKIQVKTSIDARNGVVNFDLTSSTTHRKNGKKHIYSKDEIDYFALYSIKRDKIFFVDVNDAPKTYFSIRYEPSKNSQAKGIRREEDYLIENVLQMHP